MNCLWHGKPCRKWETPFDLADLEERIKGLNEVSQQPDFWEDHQKASRVLKEKKGLENRVGEFYLLERELSDVEVLLQLALEEEEEELTREIQEAYDRFTETTEDLRLKILLNEEYDFNSAIIHLHAGEGGKDAQDWTEMLMRMYGRWTEKKGYKLTIADVQYDTEGGIKSATMMVEGEYAYGFLKNEKGVHRLVRISPFDSSGRRHTSFAGVDVMPEIEDDITIDIDASDLRIDTYRSSGAGGQHVNKTDSAIRITHLPTNIVVTCQNERSQHQNKETAMKLLRSKLMDVAIREHKESLKELKGDYSQIAWGSQIRSYVFHPYTMVKDHRTGAEVGNIGAVMDGEIDYFINEKLKQRD
jgi:peptide chain release factor 2